MPKPSPSLASFPILRVTDYHLPPRRSIDVNPTFKRIAIIAGVVIVALAIGALYVVARNVYFVGTDDSGFVTLYRGLPYDLPLGVRLYTSRYVSGVPALSIPAERRQRVLDHQLRSRGDAADLIESLDKARSD
jgi:protein phosphatase